MGRVRTGPSGSLSWQHVRAGADERGLGRVASWMSSATRTSTSARMAIAHDSEVLRCLLRAQGASQGFDGDSSPVLADEDDDGP